MSEQVKKPCGPVAVNEEKTDGGVTTGEGSQTKRKQVEKKRVCRVFIQTLVVGERHERLALKTPKAWWPLSRREVKPRRAWLRSNRKTGRPRLYSQSE